MAKSSKVEIPDQTMEVIPMSEDRQAVIERYTVETLADVMSGLESVTVKYGNEYRATLAELLLGNKNGMAAGLNNFGVSVQRTVSHQMQNVSDATLSSWIRTDKLGLKASNAKDMSDTEKKAITAQISKWRKDNPDVCDEKLGEIRAAQWDTIVNGKMQLSVRGPRRDPVEVEFDNLVLQEAQAQLFRFSDVNGVRFNTWPSSDDTVLVFAAKNADGTNMTRTRVQMLDNIRAKNGDEFKMRAEEIVALRNAKATTDADATSPDEAGI